MGNKTKENKRGKITAVKKAHNPKKTGKENDTCLSNKIPNGIKSIKEILKILIRLGIVDKTVTSLQMINAFKFLNYSPSKMSSPQSEGIKQILKIKTNLREILEHLTPDDQCIKHMANYFASKSRTQVVKVLENYLIPPMKAVPPEGELFKQFKDQEKLGETILENWASLNGGMKEVSRVINSGITALASSRNVEVRLNLDSVTATINFLLSNELETDGRTKSNFYNPNFPLYGIYNKPHYYKFGSPPNQKQVDFNLGKCWICGCDIAIFTGFGTLTRTEQPPARSYGLVCTGLGECEHVFPVIDAAKFGQLVDKRNEGVVGEYYPSHTHCNQVKNDLQLWYKNVTQSGINIFAARLKIQELLKKIKNSQLNANEKNKNLLSLINKTYPNDAALSSRVEELTRIVNLTINNISTNNPRFLSMAILDAQEEAVFSFHNMATYIDLSDLAKQQGKFGGQKGGNVENEKEEIKTLIRNTIIKNTEFVLEDTTISDKINNMFNKINLEQIGDWNIIANYIQEMLYQKRMDREEAYKIITSFENNYKRIIDYKWQDLTEPAHNTMSKIVRDKYVTDDDIESLFIELQNMQLSSSVGSDHSETSQLPETDNGTKNVDTTDECALSFDILQDLVYGINLNIVDSILADILVKNESIIIVIHKHIVYISEMNDIKPDDEAKFITIDRNTDIIKYRGQEYNITDIAIKNIIVADKKPITFILDKCLELEKKEQLDDVLKILNVYDKTDDILENTGSNENMLKIAIREEAGEIDDRIDNLKLNNPDLAYKLEESANYITDPQLQPSLDSTGSVTAAAAPSSELDNDDDDFVSTASTHPSPSGDDFGGGRTLNSEGNIRKKKRKIKLTKKIKDKRKTKKINKKIRKTKKRQLRRKRITRRR